MENSARNDNCTFVDPNGKLIKMMLFGEIAHSSLGTQLDCKGKHYMTADNVRNRVRYALTSINHCVVHRRQIQAKILSNTCQTVLCYQKHQHSIWQHLQRTTKHLSTANQWWRTKCTFCTSALTSIIFNNALQQFAHTDWTKPTNPDTKTPRDLILVYFGPIYNIGINVFLTQQFFVLT
jgi:hypothetical protein